MEKRSTGFVIVAAVYVLASLAGILIYDALPFDMWLSLLIADTAATVLVFVFSVIFKNASVYDPYWSVQPIVILTAAAVKSGLAPAGVFPLVAVWYWGTRLTANWAYTFHGLKFQDWRYTKLKEDTGGLYPLVNFFGIHLVPTLIVYACVLPAVYTMLYRGPVNVGCVLFSALSVFAATMQGVADIQMHRFRKIEKGFIRTGLWKWSRHPNYLGEILMWWGIGLLAVSVMPDRWYLLAGAAANTLLFLFISIPMADGKQSKKPGFDEYKRQTRMLLPVKKTVREEKYAA